MAFTDIRAEGWVARAPAAWRPYLLLARLDRPIGIWLLYLPGVWGIVLARLPLVPTLHLLGLFAIGAIAMRAAGCVINDWWDRELDRQVARTAARPLAAGHLTGRDALLFLAVLLTVALTVLLQLNPLCWVLGAAILVPVILYPLAKRVTWWPQLVMGFTFGFGAPMGYAAATGRLDAAALALYAAAILWDLGFDTIYGFQDIEDDAMIGVKSTSRRFAHMPRLFVGLAYALAVTALIAAARFARLPSPWLLGLTAAPLLAQAAAIVPTDPATCLSLFRRNREAGIAIALALAGARW